jgi:RNA polymerase sigma-70 factor (ECF subfamily)
VHTTLKATGPNIVNSIGLDQKSFDTLYYTYSPTLFSVLYKFLKDRVLAEDALQNTFLKIWLHRESYDVLKGTPFTWMLNIARNEALDVLRSKPYRERMLTGVLNDSLFSSHEKEFTRFDLFDLHKQLFILKPLERNILELCFLRGFTCREVSELLSLPIGTVKTSMQRSYKKLRAVMNVGDQ